MSCDRRPRVEPKKLVYPQYLIRFFIRLCIFFLVFYFFLFAPEQLDLTRSWREAGLLSPAHLLCAAMTVTMVAQHMHRPGMSMGRMKQYAKFCDIEPSYDPQALRAAVRRQDRGALRVLAVWLAGNAVVAVLYLRGVISVAWLVMLTAFYYLSDMVCILFLCPFQLFLMGNRCCVSCRIFAWGSWMMVTLLMLLPSPVTAVPLVLALTLLVRWEFHYRRHPEQFWSGSNRKLRCAHCTERLCRHKPLRPASKEP